MSAAGMLRNSRFADFSSTQQASDESADRGEPSQIHETTYIVQSYHTKRRKIVEVEVNKDLSGGSAAVQMACLLCGRTHSVVPTTPDKGPI